MREILPHCSAVTAFSLQKRGGPGLLLVRLHLRHRAALSRSKSRKLRAIHLCYNRSVHQSVASIYNVMLSIENLPHELLLEVFTHIQIPEAWDESYLSRQTSNKPRTPEYKKPYADLLSVCLASKRLLGFAEPILYSSIVIRTSSGQIYPRTFCLLTALRSKPRRASWIRSVESDDRDPYSHLEPPKFPALGDEKSQQKPTAICGHTQNHEQDCKFLLSIAEQIAEQIWEGEQLERWGEKLRTSPGELLVTLVIGLSMNITYLAIECFAYDPLVLRFMYRSTSGTVSQPLINKFEKLTRLSINADYSHHDWTGNTYGTYCHDVSKFLHSLPNLQYYEQHRVCERFLECHEEIRHKNLLVLRLNDCFVPLKQMDSLLRRCESLQELSCLYRGVWEQAQHILLPAIYSLAHNLRRLELRFDNELPDEELLHLWPLPISEPTKAQLPIDFSPFHHLRLLSVPDYFLMGYQTERKEPSGGSNAFAISNYLPRKLAHLIISMERRIIQVDTPKIWGLAADSKLFPDLKRIEIVGFHFTMTEHSAPDLIDRFRQEGVLFTTPISKPLSDVYEETWPEEEHESTRAERRESNEPAVNGDN
ncbi:hypothetical protein FB567DRAFT_233466 [Paraphoma chrysanthemicola]|uniref:Uncharacterized protein n=1 Tax=Paraphoma chrysanthemicola TaxID=798071 RepID=A0A8K0RFN7_9PLEO|nr:hypothetical protein FB567DRAFT_233466 [Paraphoma chrysanthemicola]